MKSFVLTLALGLSTLAAPVAAQSKAQPAAAPSIAGTWDASMNTPGGAVAFKIIFKVDSLKKLTGTVKRTAGDAPLTGSIKGDTVTFTYEIDYNGPFTLTMTATVSGDTMKGTVDMGGQAEDDFSAKRAPPISSALFR